MIASFMWDKFLFNLVTWNYTYLFLTILLVWVDLCDSCTQISDIDKWTHRSDLSLCWWLAGCFWNIFSRIYGSVQLLSCVRLFTTAMDCTMPGFPVHHQLPELKLMSIESAMSSNHLILCCSLLLPPSIFPSIRVFSNELVLHIRWPKYWSFSISPSNEHSGLISFRMDWLDLFAIQGTLKSPPQHHSSKASILRGSAFFIVQLSYPYMTTGQTIAWLDWLILKF